MEYFEDLYQAAKVLSKESMGHLETTKRFRAKLETTKRQLEEDFSADAIKDMFEFNDQFWTNSLAE
jgi:hypothetical protein